MGYFRPKDLPKVLGDPKPEKTPPKGKKPIKKMSEKREDESKEYKELRLQFLKENPICIITGNQATEIHHKYSGKDRGKYFLDTTTWLAVSRYAHEWIHENSKEARELGYLY